MLKNFTVSAALLLTANLAQADIITSWNLTSAAGNEALITAATSAANVTGINLTRGSGLSADTAAGFFNAKGWDDLSTNDYFSFGFSVDAGYAVNLTDLRISTRSSNRGPGTLGLFYSGDSFASNLHTFTQANNNAINTIVNLSTLTNLVGLVEFRVMALSGVSANGNTMTAGGTFRVGEYINDTNNMTFNGSVAAAVPEPASYAMLLVGLGLLAFSAKRRQSL